MSYLHIDRDEVAFTNIDDLTARYRDARKRTYISKPVFVTRPAALVKPTPVARVLSAKPTPVKPPARRLGGATRRATVIDIQRMLAWEFGVTRNDILSHRRDWQAVAARQAAVWLTKEMLPLSLPQIGKLFGGRDHTTILHSIRKISAMRDSSEIFRNRLDELRASLSVGGLGPDERG